ncbi:MAG: ABC transporter substrate-binding protein [Actinomycetes bacterium]
MLRRLAPLPRARVRLAAPLLVAATLGLAACSSGDTTTGDASAAPGGASSASSGASTAASPPSYADVEAKAKGQTVNWYMYGGDDVLNGFINGYVKQQLAAKGVTLNQVKITDTADAVNKVLAEKQAGKDTDGSVDLIWINGENFATGKQAKLWYCGYPTSLPNATYVDFSQPAVSHDFGLPVDGCESVWQQANSALVYDSAKLKASDVASVDSLFAWAKAHPGQFTYPAPPDFTGSMAVRTFFYDTAGGPDTFQGGFNEQAYSAAADKLWQRLNGIEPSLWKKGETYPQTEDDVEKLYASGQIAAFLTYGPGAVGPAVAKGTYPDTTREAILSVGNISNYSFVAIPYNSPHKEGAEVLANLLLDPQTQLGLYKATGSYPAIDLTKVDPKVKQAFESVSRSPSVLSISQLQAHAQPELSADYVTRIEKDWKTNVLQQ